jgi:WD40 repeat protein
MCLKAPGNIIISGCGNGLINIFDLETGECIQTINEHTDLVRNILIVSDNRFVTCSNDKTIKLFDLNNFECIRTLFF